MKLTKQQIIDDIKANLAETGQKPWVSEANYIASRAFLGVKDKSGKDYAIHWLTVAFDGTNSDIKRQIGLLHDLLEDTDWTADDLRDLGFDERVVQGVIAMTRDEENESYFDFIERCAKDPYAIDVKLKDLRHNLDGTRYTTTMTERDVYRTNKYIISYNYLVAVKQGKIQPGSPVEDFVASHKELNTKAAQYVLNHEGRQLPKTFKKGRGLTPR